MTTPPLEKNLPVIRAALKRANVLAFLRMLRTGETTQTEDAYRWLFGSTVAKPKLLDNFADHPRVRTYEAYDGQFIKNGKIDYTTAAGAYQITESTWEGLVRNYGFTQFDPETQDLAAVALILEKNALGEVIAGDIEGAIVKLRPVWASLPGASHGDQPTVAFARARGVYLSYGGELMGVAPAPQPSAPVQPRDAAAQPVEAPSPAPTPVFNRPVPSEESMTPFIAAALPAIIDAVPKLATIFSSGSQVAERNIKAAETVVSVAKGALQAHNEQELVERLQADPAAAGAVRQAVEANWYQIHQEAEKSIAAAREFATAYVKAKDVRTVVGGFTFPELLSLIFVVISAIGAGIVLAVPGYSAEIRGSVITLMLIAGYTGVREFWFGSSPVEQAKVNRPQ